MNLTYMSGAVSNMYLNLGTSKRTIGFSSPTQEKFIACYMNKARWNCNLNELSLIEAEEWLKMNNKRIDYTTLIPFNHNFIPVPYFFKKIYVSCKLKEQFKTNFIN